MHHVGILEAADHHCDGVHLANVAQEGVSEACSAARAPHQAGDIDETHARRDDTIRVDDFGEHLEALVRDGNVTDVRIDGGERIVRRQRGRRAGQGVENGGLADVRKSYDSAGERHVMPTRPVPPMQGFVLDA